MRKLSIFAVLAASAVAVSLSSGSSHREAPNILNDPLADNTDVYAFTANDAPGALTVVANWIPLEEPAGGPNFYVLDDKARYYVHVDNTGDGAEDVSYRFEFRTRFRNERSFLYAAPTVQSIRDRNLFVQQTYDVYRESRRRGRVHETRIGRNLPVAPNNVGPKTIPDYNAVANQGIRSLRGGGRVFVGQRDDPFFVDLGTTFDGVNLDKPGRPNIGTGNRGGGTDDVAPYNTHSFVLQVPERQVTRNGRSVSGAGASNAVVGVWATTERRRLEVTGTFAKPREGRRTDRRQGGYVQVSRLGNPLVNEVVIPLSQKDRFNRTSPKDDAKNFGSYVVRPELAGLMNALFNLNVKTTNRTDIVTALLTGVPGLTKIGRRPAAADTLKINLGVPPNPSPNRFGVLAGDNAGFPNGRRLGDDVVDIELRVIAGALLPENQGGRQIPLGDGVDQNDRPFLAGFPYVPPPKSGFDPNPKRVEPEHEPTPQPPQ